jgi:adhesin/invasin
MRKLSLLCFVSGSLIFLGCGPKPNLDVDTCNNNLVEVGEVCFEAPPILPSPAPLLDALLLDIDDDTLVDLVTAAADGFVYIYRGNPDGGFNKLDLQTDRLGIGAPSRSKPHRIIAADLQRDQRTDLVLLVEEPGGIGAVYSLLSVGGGNFLDPVRSDLSGVPVDGELITNAADTTDDLLVLLPIGLEILRGDGSGSFADPLLQKLNGISLRDITLEALNADALDDLLVADEESSATRLIANNDGTYSDSGQTVIPPSNHIALEEFSGGGERDVASADAVGGSVSVLRGLGNGDFETITSIFVGDNPLDLKLVDLDGDGFLDLTAAGGMTASFLRGLGGGTFEEATPTWSGAGLNKVFVDDVTLDQANDVIAVGELGVSLIEGRLGSFPKGIEIPLGKDRPKVAVLADFDGDGDLDLALSVNVGVMIFSNDSTGAFAFDAPQVIPLDPTPAALAVGDVDADGDIDLVTLDPKNQLDPNGDGTGRIIVNEVGVFTAVNVLPLSGLPAGAVAIFLRDINGDKRDDLIALGTTSALLESDGQRFINPQTLALTNATQGALIDLNQDDAPELIVGQADTVKIFIGPDFTQAQSISFVGASLVTAADLNSDNLNDLVVLDTSQQKLSILLGEGNFAFAAAISVLGPEGAQGLAVGDSDADKIADVLVVGKLVSQVFVLEGQGLVSRLVRGVSALAVGGVPGVLLNQDLDGDGTFDLVLPAKERGLLISRQKH